MKKLSKLSKLSILLFVLYWLPFLFISSTYHSEQEIVKLPTYDAVIVFGTLVRNKKVSALLKERLDAGIAIFKAHKAKKIVVSNVSRASKVMRQYLIRKGIPSKKIELDISAEKTPDTCRYEKKTFSQKRKLIFVSQGYHLARISYQCNKLGIKGATFAAENIRTNRASIFSSWEVFSIRIGRYFREAGLTWLAFLGVYH